MVFAFKTATLAPELQVSMGPSPHLWFCAFTTATLWPELIDSMGPRPYLSFCACKTAWLPPELLVSMRPRPHMAFCVCKTTWLESEKLVSKGHSPHLWFLHAKQRLLVQNYKSLWPRDFACWIVHVNNVISIRKTSLYGSPSSSVVFACKTSTFGSELQVSMGPRLRLLICKCKTAC